MGITVKAIYENGVFRPIGPMPDYGEGAKVILTISKRDDKKALRALRRPLSIEDMIEMIRVIREECRVEGAE